MAVSRATLKTITDAVKLEVLDTDTANPRGASYTDVVNRAIRQIAKDSQYLERIKGIVTDGLSASFTLTGEEPENLADDYFGIYQVYYNGLALDLDSSLQQPERYIASGVVSDYGRNYLKTMMKYKVFGDELNLDFIPEVSANMIIDTDDSTFAAAGNWVAVGGALTYGTRLTYTANNALDHSISLPSTAVTSQLYERCYAVTGLIRKGVAWSGGNVIVTVNGHSQTITPTLADQRFTIKYKHRGSDTDIAVTFSGLPLNNDVLYLDDVYFYDCPLSLAYYALPQSLASDNDNPEGALAQFDMLLIAASMLQLPKSFGVDKDEVKEDYDKELKSFLDTVNVKGKNQRHKTRGNYYGV
jgi:hypothetical protein